MSAVRQRGSGWVTFAGIMVAIVGVLNVIYGIAAIDKASFFVEEERFIISNLQTWGWVTLVLGVVQLFAAASIWRGGIFGPIVGIFGASLSAIAALMSMPGYPFWSLAIFAVDVLVIYGLVAHGGEQAV
jgi:hypothetical protein